MKRSLCALIVGLFGLAVHAATVTVGSWTPIFKGIGVASGQQAGVSGENHRTMCLRVDLTDPDVVLFTTPRCTNCGTFETLAENTSHFLEQWQTSVAVNGALYSSSLGPNDVPLVTTESVLGMTISFGNLVSAAEDRK